MTQLENKVHQAIPVLDADSGKLLNYRELMKYPKCRNDWRILLTNKFGCLANDLNKKVSGTRTIKFTHTYNVPRKTMKDVTYGNFVCNVHPKKVEKN